MVRRRDFHDLRGSRSSDRLSAVWMHSEWAGEEAARRPHECSLLCKNRKLI